MTGVQKMVLPKGAFEAIQNVVAKMAAQKAATMPPKEPRSTLLSQAREAVAGGNLPPMLEFNSERNYSYNTHAKALHQLADVNDVAGLVAYPLKGSNTYARALIGYRDLLLDHLKAAKVSGEAKRDAQSNAQKATKQTAPQKTPATKATKATAKAANATASAAIRTAKVKKASK